MLVTMFIAFLTNILLGIPLFICLLLTAVIGLMFIDPMMLPRILPQQFFGGIDTFALMAIPLFILAGNLMNCAGMTEKLMRLARALVGHLRGGLGYVNVISSVFFAGVNGSAVADTSALGSLLVPAMKKEGYSPAYAAGLTAGSSLIGPIIPPSIFMILYGSLTNTSVGDLFLAGIIPGLILGVAFMVMNWFYARRANLPVSSKKASIREFSLALLGAMPALIAPFIIVIGIVFGFVTPTESGVLIVAYVAIVGMLSRELKFKTMLESIRKTVMLTGTIFIIMAASSVISWLLSYAQVPSQFASMLAPFQDNPILVLLMLSAITFITGMFMEEISSLMLLTPIFIPVATMAGIDPVHLGIIITLNITIALITPPMGACIFVAAAVSNLPIISLFKTIWPFVLLAVSVLILLILFPQITLFIPNLVG